MSQDLKALLLSYAYVGACVLVGEVLARRGASREFSRKFIHVGVGLWIFAALTLFEHREWAVVPSLTAAVANWVIHRKRLLKAVETEPDNLGTLVAANADTWATELGVLSRSLPRSITTLRPVAPGTSGAVSGVGLLASTAGAAFVGVLALLAGISWQWLPWLVLAGVVGSLVDSFLGATVQDVRWCEACARETERRVHHCGQPTRALRGVSWLGNDTVNVVATAAGALLAFCAA